MTIEWARDPVDATTVIVFCCGTELFAAWGVSIPPPQPAWRMTTNSRMVVRNGMLDLFCKGLRLTLLTRKSPASGSHTTDKGTEAGVAEANGIRPAIVN